MANKKIRTSTGWLVGETIKGLPEAGEKVGKTIGKAVGKVMKAPFSVVKAVGKAIKGTPPKPLSPEETKSRQEKLEQIKKSIEEYKEKHPGFKVPREFK